MRRDRTPGSTLLGRQRECEELDRLLTDVFAGRSRVLVLWGDVGIGKSALLGYLTEQVVDWHVAVSDGVESEMDLDYGALHQLCGPMLDQLERLPPPQREALETVFGRRSGPAPERFMVGLAALTLFAVTAEQRPLLCIVDDAQWVDHASARIISFVARRLVRERVALVCASRTRSVDDLLSGLPELSVRGLGTSDSRALLLDHVHGPLDAAVCAQIVTESHGNPLALLEFPRTWNMVDLAGGFGLPDSQPAVSPREQSYAELLQGLPSPTRLLALTAAADPLGDPLLLHRATQALGVDIQAAGPAVDAGLIRVGWRVEFAHPLVRSAAYRSASAAERQRVHRALAEATDPDRDPDRRAWHRARATPGPGEDVAAELERSAGRARARGGVAAAAAFLQRALALTVDPAQRAERALAAATASLQAGAFDAALGLLDTAEAAALDDFQRARVEAARSEIAFASGSGVDALALWLKAARQLEPFDVDLARESYLKAWGAAHFAGDDALVEICRAVQALPTPAASVPRQLLLEGLALLGARGHAAAAATLRQAAGALNDLAEEDALGWGWIATAASAASWDVEGMLASGSRAVQLLRGSGAVAQLPIPLALLGSVTAWSGDFAGAASMVADADHVAMTTGTPLGPYAELSLLAWQGREAEALSLIADTLTHAVRTGRHTAAAHAHWAAAVLCNGLGRYDEATSAAQQAATATVALYDSMWALPELVEAAARAGHTELARDALERLAATTRPSGGELALGIESRSRAVISDEATAEPLYGEAVARLGRTPLRPELARAHLLYGEWLRRQGRRRDAREQLRAALDLFVVIGMDAFAERARRELVATGEKVRRRSIDAHGQLTPQEHQIARLARDGLSNPEIGARLFISARTVEWHLGKVFTKLRISSRRQLRAALREDGRVLARA